MYSTRNDLPEATRVKVIELLDARLANAADLQTQIKQAHWNVKGPNFIGCSTCTRRGSRSTSHGPTRGGCCRKCCR
jgi:hypothetical protein